MTPSNPCQPLPRKHSQTPATPSIGKGLGLGVVDHPFHLAAVTELNPRGETISTPVSILAEAHSTLQAMHGYYGHREVFTAGMAAGNRRDRAAVDQAISELTAWSEHALYCASFSGTTPNLEKAANLARAARIVWCCYIEGSAS